MKTDILSKIEELFWENAFAELSMDEVGKCLGIKKSSLYYHFPSKDQMFIEALEYSYEKYRKSLEDIFLKEDLKEIIIALINFPLKSKNLFAVVLQK
jgi:AcrR family transcriptional regulator